MEPLLVPPLSSYVIPYDIGVSFQLATMVLLPVEPTGIVVGDQLVKLVFHPSSGVFVGVAKVIVGVVMLYADGLDPLLTPPFIV